MPPHLHPRSTATSTLFAGTLLASFIVVGIPHVFPCPRPRTGYAADSGQIEFNEDGKPIRRVRKRPRHDDTEGVEPLGSIPLGAKQTYTSAPSPPSSLNLKTSPNSISASQKPSTPSQPDLDLDEQNAIFAELAAEAAQLEHKAKLARECPVPKPSGWVGRVLGFEQQSTRNGARRAVDRAEKG